MSKTINWLPQIVEATVNDIARFGPNAARVRALLEFLPTMSDEAAQVSGQLRNQIPTGMRRNQAFDAAKYGVNAKRGPRSLGKATVEAYSSALEPAKNAAFDAAMAESALDLIDDVDYTYLTNPLAVGRAVDLLRNRPRYQGTPFLDVVSTMASRGAVSGPRDVVSAGRLARSPEDVRDIAFTLISDGMSIEEALKTARML